MWSVIYCDLPYIEVSQLQLWGVRTSHPPFDSLGTRPHMHVGEAGVQRHYSCLWSNAWATTMESIEDAFRQGRTTRQNVWLTLPVWSCQLFRSILQETIQSTSLASISNNCCAMKIVRYVYCRILLVLNWWFVLVRSSLYQPRQYTKKKSHHSSYLGSSGLVTAFTSLRSSLSW